MFSDVDLHRYEVIPDRTDTDLAAMAGDKTRWLHAYWQALHRGAALPLADDFRVIDAVRVAPCLLLLDVVRGDGGRLRHRYRYVGTRIADYRYRRGLADHTGTFADEAPRYYSGDQLVDSYLRCTEEAVPVLTTGNWGGAEGVGRFERLALPLLAADGTTVSRLAVCVDRFDGR